VITPAMAEMDESNCLAVSRIAGDNTSNGRTPAMAKHQQWQMAINY